MPTRKLRCVYDISSLGFFLAFLGGCAMVSTGRTGIEWTPTSETLAQPLAEGVHAGSPLARIYYLDLREQEHEEPLDVLANNGLDIRMMASILH